MPTWLQFVIQFVLGGAWGFYAYRWGHRVGKRHRPLHPDVTVDTLEEALRLDRALENCQHPTAWVGHDHDAAPHVGVWLYESGGRIHISSRFITRGEARTSGRNAAEAIMNFRNLLLDEAHDKERRLKDAVR